VVREHHFRDCDFWEVDGWPNRMEAERPCYSATDGLDDSSVALHVQDRTIWLEAVLRLECHLS